MPKQCTLPLIVNDTLEYRMKVPRAVVEQLRDGDAARLATLRHTALRVLDLPPETALSCVMDVIRGATGAVTRVDIRCVLPRPPAPVVVVLLIRGAGNAPDWVFGPKVLHAGGDHLACLWSEADVQDGDVLDNVRRVCAVRVSPVPTPFQARVQAKVERLLQDDAVKRVVVVGHSHGGLVASRIAEALDDRWGASNRLWVVTLGTVYVPPPQLVPKFARAGTLVHFMFPGDVSLRCTDAKDPRLTWLPPPADGGPDITRTPLHVLGSRDEWRTHSGYNIPAFLAQVAALAAHTP